MITRCAVITLALVFGALNAACGGSAGTAAIPTSAPATATAIDAVPVATPTAAPPQRQEAASWVYTGQHGKATASLEERVYLADVVVRARLVSAADDVLTFRAITYLKGGGRLGLRSRPARRGGIPNGMTRTPYYFSQRWTARPRTLSLRIRRVGLPHRGGLGWITRPHKLHRQLARRDTTLRAVTPFGYPLAAAQGGRAAHLRNPNGTSSLSTMRRARPKPSLRQG